MEDRIETLKAIRYIDRVVWFDSQNMLRDLLKKYESDIIVIGSDWKGKRVIGEEYTKEVKFFDRIEEYSTKKIINNIMKINM